MAYCDPDDSLARPAQLIRRDDYGNDEDTLDIFGPTYGGQGVTLHEGYEGWYHQDATVVREEGAYQRGSTPSDVPRIKERILTFTLGTQAPTPALWEEVETRLWKFWRFDRDCVLRVYSHRSEPREIRVRKERKPKDLLQKGPGLNRFAAWEIVALACDPDWQSQELSFTVKRSEMTSLGGGVYEGFFPMYNPADQWCYPIFATSSLGASATITVPDKLTGRTIAVGPLTPGQEALIRTDPMVATVLTRNGTIGPWVKLGARAFDAEPLEGGLVDPVMVPVRITGGTPDTQVTLYLPQKWERPWGGES